MKIDTTMIPNFDALPEEAKEAILSMEFDDAPDMSQFVSKAVFDKKASEAADLSKQLKSKMSQDEQEAAKQAETLANMQAELEALRQEKTVSDLTKRWMGVGYSEELATSTAKAMTAGELDAVFKNHAKFLADREKALKAELLKQTPTPAAGGASTNVTKEQFDEMDYSARMKLFDENRELYDELNGGN